MNKKLLVGSIGAVLILVLAGFTSAVGNLNEENINYNESPLYSVRTNNAINSEGKEINTVTYIRKGYFLTALPELKDRLYNMFGVQISEETQNIIRKQLENNPLLINRIMENDNEAINSIIDLIYGSGGDSINFNMKEPEPTTGGPNCPPPPSSGSCTSEFEMCDCFFGIFILLFITAFLTIFFLPFLLMDGTLTSQ